MIALGAFQMNSGADALLEGNRTLCSGVGAQNEGKIGSFDCGIFLTKVYITLIISKTMNSEDLVHGS